MITFHGVSRTFPDPRGGTVHAVDSLSLTVEAGETIVTGLQLDDTNLILSGALPAALLAIACDFALSALERRLSRRRTR